MEPEGNMPEQTGLLVKDVVEGGSASQGEQVFFTLRLDNGESERNLMFICPQEKYPNLLQALITYGGAADKERASGADSGNGQATMRMLAASKAKAGSLMESTDGESKVALRFTLPTGMNFDVSLNATLARDLIGQIEEQLQD
tara:strand:+ start:528 stop:956 length:429 start_codon:yes stop_codon:yes gene_type:complete